MSEKQRFEITDYGSEYYIEIIDNKKKLDKSIDNPTQKLDLVECCDLLNSFHQENQKLQEKIMKVKQSNNHYYTEYYRIKEEDDNCKNDYRELFSNYVALEEQNKQLMEENKKLKGLIKGNVFGKYREGSLADLEFKAIAYDDIVKLEMSYESEPKVIVICKQGKKENVKSFCQMFIPLGVCYEIKEVNE